MYLEKKQYPFCPGCSHVQVLDAIGRALEKIKANPHRTVMVSDIGCVGLVDSYFKVHTFHGLHGRSFTYACGLKLANPRLNVFVMVGDGGCGIGGHHLINAARRNIGIKVIVFNNFNFGMTGGQHSVTSPLMSKTKTTPEGHLERGFDLAKLVQAAGAPFVARKLAFDKDLDETIVELFRFDGFAFLDAWEVCTAYYMPANDFKRPQMVTELERSGMKLGVLLKETIPPYPAGVGPIKEVHLKPKGIEKRFDHSLAKDPVSVVIAGSAGMKILSTAGLLGKTALKCGLHTTERDDFPITVQTGHSIAEMKFSREEIEYLGVKSPDAVLVLSEDGLLKTKKVLANLSKDSLVISLKGLPIETPAKKIELDPQGIGKKSLSITAAALLVRQTGFLPMEAFREALNEIPNETIRKENLLAIEMAERI